MSVGMFNSPEKDVLRSVQAYSLEFVPSRDASVLHFPDAELQEKDWREDGPGCVRGVRFAIAIEAAAAIAIYGLWHLSHLLR
jgi:hypothetical protein